MTHDPSEDAALDAARWWLAMLDATMLFLERRREMLDDVFDSADPDAAKERLAASLGVPASVATALLQLQVLRFTVAQRDRIAAERDALRERLDG